MASKVTLLPYNVKAKCYKTTTKYYKIITVSIILYVRSIEITEDKNIHHNFSNFIALYFEIADSSMLPSKTSKYRPVTHAYSPILCLGRLNGRQQE